MVVRALRAQVRERELVARPLAVQVLVQVPVQVQV